MSFGVALHVMIALAYHDGAYVNSENLATSVGTNAVTVRRVIGQLVEAGLVETQPGPGGGARLARSPGRVSIDDIFSAVGRPPFVRGHDREPNPACPVSRCVPQVVARLNDAIEASAQKVLGKTTLKMLIEQEING